jgi:catechol 2,3-dioxygenase-like lactoylglutathione lyase family enzyme
VVFKVDDPQLLFLIAVKNVSIGAPMITRVGIVTIPVRDQDKALAFYTKKLGFELVVDEPFKNDCPEMPQVKDKRWIELKIPKGDCKIALFTQPGHEARIGTASNIVFSTDNIEETYATLVKRGVEFTKPPEKQSWGGITAFFKDVDGNIFCLCDVNSTLANF